MIVTTVTHHQGEIPRRIEIGSNVHGLRICALEVESLDELKKIMSHPETREWLDKCIRPAWVVSTYKKGDRDGLRN